MQFYIFQLISIGNIKTIYRDKTNRKDKINMVVYEITVKAFLLEDTPVSLVSGALAQYIDSYLVKDTHFAELHHKNAIKGYSFDMLSKIEKGMKVYKRDQIYQFRIRTVNQDLMSYLMEGIADHRTNAIKGLTRTVKQIPRKPIASVWTLTPYIFKTSKGYWRDCMGFEEFEQALCASLIHQYESYTSEEVEKNVALYDQIELKSKCAIGVSYKGITLLGDKIAMQVSDNETAQKIFYFTLANAIGMGPRGQGFLGLRFVNG